MRQTPIALAAPEEASGTKTPAHTTPASGHRLLPGRTQPRWYGAAFWLACLTAALFILPSMLPGGTFYIGSDYVHQQVPFWSYANQAIKDGSILWADSLDLGTQFIGGFSFYVIGSPFFWLSLLLPARLFYIAAPFLLILKIGVAGLAAFSWLRSYTRTPQYALLGSLLYAFCGFQISNLNFNHFADVVALFPFLLLTLDKAVLANRRQLFALVVALCAFCSWYSFIGQVVFLVLYVLIKRWSGEYPKFTARLFCRLGAESLLGVGLAAVLLLPSVLFMLGNPRLDQGFTGLAQMLVAKPIQLAELVRGMLLPPECGFYRGFFMQGLFNGGELYLPLFGLVPAAAYVLTHRKGFEAKMLLVCLVFMLVPVLNSVFVAFNAEYYTRWFYMPSLILALASARALEDQSLSLKRGYLFYCGLWAVFALIFAWFTWYFKVTFFYNLVPVAVFCFLSLAGFGITLLVRRIQRWRRGFALLLAGVMGFAACTGLYNIYLMHKCWDGPGAPAQLYAAPDTLELPQTEQYYRMDADGYHFFNLGAMLGLPSMDSFTSTISGSTFDFYELAGVPRSVISDLPASDYGYRAFLSARYWVRYGANAQADADAGWQPYAVQGNFHIYENAYYIPLGYCYDAYITEADFRALPADKKHLALTQALVLTDEQAARFGHLLAPAQSLADTDHQAFAENVALRRTQSAYQSAKTNTGYTLDISMERENLVFLSIPWDAGWRATVNGTPAKIEKAAAGFMAVLCPAGENRIQLHYNPPGGQAGLYLSIGSALLLAGWALGGWLRRKKCGINRNKRRKIH